MYHLRLQRKSGLVSEDDADDLVCLLLLTRFRELLRRLRVLRPS